MYQALLSPQGRLYPFGGGDGGGVRRGESWGGDQEEDERGNHMLIGYAMESYG